MKRVITALAPLVLLLGITAPAAAHQADWYDQAWIALNEADKSCRYRSKCVRWDYVGYWETSLHSRAFKFHLLANSPWGFTYPACVVHVSIDHYLTSWKMVYDINDPLRSCPL